MIKLIFLRRTCPIVLIFLLKSSLVVAQVVFSDWIVSSGKKGWDIVNSMTCDSSENIYITGSHNDSIKSMKSSRTSVNTRKCDFLEKYDTSGKIIWTKKIKTSVPGYGSLLSTTHDGQIIMVGAHEASQKRKKPDIKKLEFFISCFGKNGDLKWTKSFSGSKFDCFTSIAIEPLTNKIFLGGYFCDTLTIQNRNFIKKGKSDAIFLGFNSLGELESFHQLGNVGENKITAITTDNLGNAIILGTFQKTISFSDSIKLTLNEKGETGVFIAKYSSSGTVVSAKIICSGQNVLANSITCNDCLCFIAGSFQNFLKINHQLEPSRGSYDVFVVCLDNYENFRWFKHIGGTRKDRANDIRIDNQEVILSGSFCSKLAADNISITSKMESSDVFILSLDTLGKLKWIRSLGGENDDYPKCMKIINGHYIYICGSYRNSISVGEKSIQSKGDEDIFIARLENCSNLAPKFKKPESFCKGSTLTLDAGSGFDLYNWNNGQSTKQLYTVDEAGVYSIELVSKTGCILYDTIKVKENPLPEISLGKDTTITNTSSLILHISGKYREYLWSNGGKDSVNVILGKDYQEGKNTIWVTVKDTNGCQGYSEMNLTILKAGQNNASNALSNSCIIFPNPTNDVLTVYFTTSLENLC